jgi:hypothetical protein
MDGWAKVNDVQYYPDLSPSTMLASELAACRKSFAGHGIWHLEWAGECHGECRSTADSMSYLAKVSVDS